MLVYYKIFSILSYLSNLIRNFQDMQYAYSLAEISHLISEVSSDIEAHCSKHSKAVTFVDLRYKYRNDKYWQDKYRNAISDFAGTFLKKKQRSKLYEERSKSHKALACKVLPGQRFRERWYRAEEVLLRSIFRDFYMESVQNIKKSLKVITKHWQNFPS